MLPNSTRERCSSTANELQSACRLASETVEDRDARLQQMSLSQQRRLASETAEDREAHLQQGNLTLMTVMYGQLLRVLHVHLLRLAPQPHAFV